MAKKRKNLNMDDVAQILLLINKQDILGVNEEQAKEMDPQGFVAFGNTVACRNIREGILKYMETCIDEEVIPYQDFTEFNDNGKRLFKEEYGR